MRQQGSSNATAALTAARREHGCGTIPKFMHPFQATNGPALHACEFALPLLFVE
jgi:hypothetical protein